MAAAESGWTATHRFARIGTLKARLVIDTIRGCGCDEALAELQFNRRRGAMFIRNVLRSAMASANEAEANMRRLVIADARVDGGPYLRRWHPKDRGRAHPIAKRMSHITITVAER
jgi:large subunit ribosomal protein L22